MLNKVKQPGKAKKFMRHWKGPYEVQQKLNGLNYKIKAINRRGKPFVVHQDLLKTYHKWDNPDADTVGNTDEVQQ